MEHSSRQQCYIFVVAPVKEDYKTGEVLLHERYYELSLKPSGAKCTVGRIGSHHIVLAGNVEDQLDSASFVNDTVNDILKEFPSIKAGFLIGAGAIAPAAGIAKTGDVVVGTPQGIEPGVVQFDASQTTQLDRLSVTYQMARPPFAVLSGVDSLRSWKGRLECHDELFKGAMAIFSSESEQENLSWSNSIKVLHGKVASSETHLPRDEVLDKTGHDSKILCFERATAKLKPHLPILTVCGITKTTNSLGNALKKQDSGTAAVIYTFLVASKIDSNQLKKQHAFFDLFSYRPFGLERPGFRLIQLQRGTHPLLSCNLFQAYLDEEQSIIPYEALSYVWGSQSTPYEIMVDGKAMSVTASLHDALMNLRQPHEDRILWVDAVCIDQSNIRERSHQVNHMGEIYRKSDNVIIWLGYLGGDSAILKTVIDQFTRQLPSDAFRKWPRGDQRWRYQWWETEKSLKISDDTILLNGLRAFMENIWFTRVWVLQEVANARRAVIECNLGKIPAKLFAMLPQIMGSPVGEQCQAVLDIMPGPSNPTSLWTQDRNLCTLLCKFKGSEASDPRDRVYALLGMASDNKASGFEADYAKEEHMVVQDLCAYIYGNRSPAGISSITSVHDLQSQLSTISAWLLAEKLTQKTTTQSLLLFLNRQGMVKEVNNSTLCKLLDHGTLLTKTYLNKCEVPLAIDLDVAKRALSCCPDVLVTFAQKQYIPPVLMRTVVSCMVENRYHGIESFLEPVALAIDPSPELIIQLVSYDPADSATLLEAVLKAFQEPIQLDENLFLDAIDNGKRTLDLVLQNCQHPIMMTQKILIKAISAGVDSLRIVLQTPRDILQIGEEALSAAVSQGLSTVQFLLGNCDGTLFISERLLRYAIKTSPAILKEVLVVASRQSIEIDGGLFVMAAEQGSNTLGVLFDHCHDPTQKVREAMCSAVRRKQSLKSFLELCPYQLELDEELLFSVGINSPTTLRLLLQHCILPINLTDAMLDIAINAGIPILEVLFENWASDVETSPAIIVQAAMAGEESLKHLLHYSKSKPQITYDILEQVKLSPSYRILLELRASERNITEDEAVKAIQTGPEAFLDLLNRRGTNFRLNGRICQVAIQHDYAFRLLRKKRPSEWFIFQPQLGSQELHPSGCYDTYSNAIRERELFMSWESSLVPSSNVEEPEWSYTGSRLAFMHFKI